MQYILSARRADLNGLTPEKLSAMAGGNNVRHGQIPAWSAREYSKPSSRASVSSRNGYHRGRSGRCGRSFCKSILCLWKKRPAAKNNYGCETVPETVVRIVRAVRQGNPITDDADDTFRESRRTMNQTPTDVPPSGRDASGRDASGQVMNPTSITPRPAVPGTVPRTPATRAAIG